jgi:hypothetical protein
MKQKKVQVRKLKKLEDLDEMGLGEKIAIIAEGCPYSTEKGIVLQKGDNLKLISSYKVPRVLDLTVTIHSVEKSKMKFIDGEGRLVCSSFGIYQLAERFQNLNELTAEMSRMLQQSGYETPGGVQ